MTWLVPHTHFWVRLNPWAKNLVLAGKVVDCGSTYNKKSDKPPPLPSVSTNLTRQAKKSLASLKQRTGQAGLSRHGPILNRPCQTMHAQR